MWGKEILLLSSPSSLHLLSSLKLDARGTIIMSMEAQFYEARRRQNILDRRNSCRSQNEIPKPNLQLEHQSLHIPVRVFRPDNARHATWSSIPMHRAKMTFGDHSLFRRDRDIYPWVFAFVFSAVDNGSSLAEQQLHDDSFEARYYSNDSRYVSLVIGDAWCLWRTYSF